MSLQTKVLMLVLLAAAIFGVGQLGLMYRQLARAFDDLEADQALAVARSAKAELTTQIEELRVGAQAWWAHSGQQWPAETNVSWLWLARLDGVARIPLKSPATPSPAAPTWLQAGEIPPAWVAFASQWATTVGPTTMSGSAGIVEAGDATAAWVMLLNRDRSEAVALVQIAPRRSEFGQRVTIEPPSSRMQQDELAAWRDDDIVVAAVLLREFGSERRIALTVRQAPQLAATAFATILGSTAVLLLGGLLLAAGFVVALRLLVLQRLSRLVRYVGMVRRPDDLNHRIDDDSADEIGQLYKAFDRMFDRLDSQAEQVRSANAELVEALRIKDDFLHRISHDLKTPLTTIKGFTAKLRHGGDPESLSEIARAADHLLALINELLDLGRARAGQLEFRLGPVDVPELLEDARRLVAVQAEAKGLTLRVETAEDVPAAWGDPRRLLQVFVNLLGNAVKFSDRGEVSVTARRDAAGTAVVVGVRDQGAGILPERLPSLFVPFSAGSGERAGSGLGLAIAKEFVERMGGRIDVESTVGVGSEFTVTLPTSAGPRSSPAPTDPSSRR